MKFDTAPAPDHFVLQFLELEGAAVEDSGDVIEAILPEKLVDSLQTPEHIVIDRTGQKESEYSATFGSALLDRMAALACNVIPVLSCDLHFHYLKKQGFDNLIAERFSFLGAVAKVENPAEIRMPYMILTCRYLAQSDEQKEGIVSLAFQMESGAYVPEMSEMFDTAEKRYYSRKNEFKDPELINKIIRFAKKPLERIIHEEIDSFQDSMDRRFRRDVESLEQYYSSLRAEMETSLERTGLSDSLIADRKEKIALLPFELEQKKADLFKKYTIRVSIRPCAVIRISSPAVRIPCSLSIGKAKKNLPLIYNPTTKNLDPLVCEGCGESIMSVRFCKNLHVLCDDCARNHLKCGA